MNAAELFESLKKQFDDAIIALEERVEPVIQVDPLFVREVGRFLRDQPELKMDFLRCMSGVDQPEAIDVVLHLLSTEHKHNLGIRLRLDRDQPQMDSLWDVWRTAEWNEREIFDLLGVRFTSHPNLTRLLLPNDWLGHPLRKDYQPPSEYHGITPERQDGLHAPKPTADDQSPPATKPDQFIPAMHEAKAEVLEGFIQLNLGPHHPAAHGVLNFKMTTDGELLSRVEPEVGYLHRGMEKLAESIPYPGYMPFTDRIDYLASMFCNWGWALAVEKLLEIEVPPRAESCRVIAGELNRIASHLVGTGSTALDLGAFTPFVHWLREREVINDITEMICGARLTYNYMRIGGVARDVSQEVVTKTLDWLDYFEGIIDEFNRLITYNEIFIKRLANVAIITTEDALSWGIVGPNLRASGVDWDLRRDEPYSIYPELDFEVVVGQAWKGTRGDAFDRFFCRIEEMRQSIKILRQVMKSMPEGDIQAKLPRKLNVPANEVYARLESARGELGFYVVSDGSDKPYRAKFRTGSFNAMSIIEHLSPGLMIADLVALIGSLDVIAPEVDR